MIGNSNVAFNLCVASQTIQHKHELPRSNKFRASKAKMGQN